MARMVLLKALQLFRLFAEAVRTAEQAEDGKIVGVDPTVITACKAGVRYSLYYAFADL